MDPEAAPRSTSNWLNKILRAKMDEFARKHDGTFIRNFESVDFLSRIFAVSLTQKKNNDFLCTAWV